MSLDKKVGKKVAKRSAEEMDTSWNTSSQVEIIQQDTGNDAIKTMDAFIRTLMDGRYRRVPMLRAIWKVNKDIPVGFPSLIDLIDRVIAGARGPCLVPYLAGIVKEWEHYKVHLVDRQDEYSQTAEDDYTFLTAQMDILRNHCVGSTDVYGDQTFSNCKCKNHFGKEIVALILYKLTHIIEIQHAIGALRTMENSGDITDVIDLGKYKGEF